MENKVLLPMLLLVLSPCCINPPNGDATTTTTLSTGYTGFPPLVAGQWAEYSYLIDGQSLRERICFIGEETVKGIKAEGIEIQMRNESGHLGTFQVWADKETRDIILYAGRVKGRVLCTSNGSILQNITLPAAFYGTLHEYLPKNAVSVGECSIPSGKTVYCARFILNDGEVLASSQVPFGIVEKKDLKLLDYGTGMERTITKKELDDCLPI